MFRILGGSAGYGDTSVRFGYEGSDASASTGCKPLDPISPATVRRIRIKEIESFLKRAQLLTILSIISVVTTTPSWIAEIQYRYHGPVTGEKYEAHLRALLEAGLIEPADQREIRHYSGYFAVDKGPTHSRAIFNGARLSRRCPAPPPVNLLCPREIIDRTMCHLRAHKTLWVVEGDLRHFFHQIPVSKDVSCTFGLRGRLPSGSLESYCWRALPMGWSWSPAVAQAVGWCLLLHHRPQQRVIFDTKGLQDPGAQLPRWVNLSNGKGFGLIYYPSG